MYRQDHPRNDLYYQVLQESRIWREACRRYLRLSLAEMLPSWCDPYVLAARSRGAHQSDWFD